MKNVLLSVLSVLFLTGCVHYMPAAVSSTSIGSKYETPVRTVTGSSSAYYIFGIGPTGDDSLNAAIEDAKSNAPSDSIANVFVDRKLICFPVCGFSIFTRIETMIYGTLVKYTDEAGAPIMAQVEPHKLNNSSQIKALSGSQETGRVSNSKCSTYDCLCNLMEKELSPAFNGLSQYEKKNIIYEARKKVRACYPEKQTNNIVVPPDINLWQGETQLLEYMCSAGFLNY